MDVPKIKLRFEPRTLYSKAHALSPAQHGLNQVECYFFMHSEYDYDDLSSAGGSYVSFFCHSAVVVVGLLFMG